VSDSSSLKAAFEKISQQYKDSPLAAAVFNSGGGFVRKPFLELTEDEFAAGYKSQGYGYFYLSSSNLLVHRWHIDNR
jgi:NAD(P)-dependent dehydrogenase (short-subunit alcohol dehydrogenase family)